MPDHLDPEFQGTVSRQYGYKEPSSGPLAEQVSS